MKAFCIHGHFYQPPREDPITGEIPTEPGAAPYRNWNERVHAECYRPNAELHNYERISFNFGPTLLSWMAAFDPVTYNQILAQDRSTMMRWGVGNGMAQGYNHTILPLATRRDKITQVRWGISDFQSRFQRRPKGMWLPETAVDYETLEVLADEGIQFTILAPWQADNRNLDTSIPYKVGLPGGKTITVFFYNQDLSTRISFDPGSTTNADVFMKQILAPKFLPNGSGPSKPQIIMMASDGELYGHHQPFRDKFLAYLYNGALGGMDLEPTFPERWLRDYPAEKTVSIVEPSSWSCHHGVLRWCGECACTPDGRWKAVMRDALNKTAEMIDNAYENSLHNWVDDPWELRNDYIQVLVGNQNIEGLVHKHASRKIPNDQIWKISHLLSAQYQRQRIFTSCGWFFDDFARIEPMNNIAYTAQAVWMTELATGLSFNREVMSLLKGVQSNRTKKRADQVFSLYYSRAQSNYSGS